MSDCRIIAHFDADCFYAQVEELRDERLKLLPLGVTQKFLVVTCNYNARKHGVTKLMSIENARKKCPDITLIDGSDLTPYKQVAGDMFEILSAYGPARKLGLDEIFVDLTAEVQRRMSLVHCPDSLSFVGHVHDPTTVQVQQESAHRVMDLRAHPYHGEKSEKREKCFVMGQDTQNDDTMTLYLKMGSMIACEARTSVKDSVGIRTSAGISHNCMLSKLISGLHKPYDQTILCREHAQDFVALLPVRALSGVGRQLDSNLKRHGIQQVRDLLQWKKEELVRLFGKKLGHMLHDACRGEDETPVLQSEAPKTISVEDSFQLCAGFQGIEQIISFLVPDLLARVDADGRSPKTLRVTWRHKEDGLMARKSASTSFPCNALIRRRPLESRKNDLVSAALALLRTKLKEPLHLTLLNIAAVNFSTISEKANSLLLECFSTVQESTRKGMQPRVQSNPGTRSKHGLRMMREKKDSMLQSDVRDPCIDVKHVQQQQSLFFPKSTMKTCNGKMSGPDASDGGEIETCAQVSFKKRKQSEQQGRPVASYRNAEAIAIRQLLTNGVKLGELHPSEDGDVESLKLAIKLQQEEWK